MPLSGFPVSALALARYRLIFQAATLLRLPDYPGSAWRGAFGRSLKRLVCVTRARHCPDCLLYRSCAYPYVFETPTDPSDALLGKVNAAPHPFVLLPDPASGGVHEPGESLRLDLTLFGHGNRQLPYILHALDQAGQHGIGTDRGTLALYEVRQQTTGDDWSCIYRPGERLAPRPAEVPLLPACPEQIRVELLTPLRLRCHGHHLTPETFTFGDLFANLLRRIALLSRAHGEGSLDVDFAALVRRARAVPLLEQQLHWQDWTRYSSRQQTLLQMGGLLGTFALDGAGLAPFWPWLWFGQWTHAGKGTSLGLGAYRLTTPA